MIKLDPKAYSAYYLRAVYTTRWGEKQLAEKDRRIRSENCMATEPKQERAFQLFGVWQFLIALGR